MMRLGDFTPARVALGRSGDSLPTKPLLEFRLAHAKARDTVHQPLDVISLQQEISQQGWTASLLRTEARDRSDYLRRPDHGRLLAAASAEMVSAAVGQDQIAVVVCDGLSALAVHRHAVPLLRQIMPALHSTRVWIVQQGRVAVGDHIGELAAAELCLLLIGERPGLSTPESLGVYLTWSPRRGRTDAERNCISNIHTLGLSYAQAAHKILFLISAARQRKLTGVALKESADQLLESL